MTQLLLLLPFIWLFTLAMPGKITKEYTDLELYKVDTSKSEILWECHHRGSLKILKGDLTFRNKELVDAEFIIDMSSIKNADIENDLLQGTLENVLRSIEFFYTAVYPQARFKLHSASDIGDDNYKITGDFIIFDTGICTTFEANICITNDSLSVITSPIILNRTDWGIYYLSRNNAFPKEEEAGFVVSDTLVIEAQIRAFRETE